MADVRARTALLQIEERLRRVFGMVGQIGLDLVPTMTPVAIATDLTRPGLSAARGRYWGFSTLVQAIAVSPSSLVLEFDAAVVVTRIGVMCENVAGLDWRVMILAPNETPLLPPDTAGGTWMDQKLVNTDNPPIRFTGLGFAVDGTVYNISQRILSSTMQAGSNSLHSVDLHLERGSNLICQALAASRIAFNVYGYIF